MSLMNVDDVVRLIDGLGGRTDTDRLLQEAQKTIDEDIVHQTVSKCIIDGKEQGRLDYDKRKEPTTVWTF